MKTIAEIIKTDGTSKDLWYDWFCTEASLPNRGKRLTQCLRAISKFNKFDINKTSVWYKNNCPCVGNLYDDFRIIDIESQDILFSVVPASGHKALKGRAEVWSHENDFNGPVITGTWKDIKNWFLNN